MSLIDTTLSTIGVGGNVVQLSGINPEVKKYESRYEYMLCKYREARDEAAERGWAVPEKEEWREEICPIGWANDGR